MANPHPRTHSNGKVTCLALNLIVTIIAVIMVRPGSPAPPQGQGEI